MSAISFGLMTVLMSGINMYSMALVMKVVLGWDINFSIWVSSLTVAAYVVPRRAAIGDLQRGSAVLSDLAGRAADLRFSGLIEAGGWSGMVRAYPPNFPGQDYTHLWSDAGLISRTTRWAFIGPELSSASGCVISFGYWTTDFLVVQRVLAAKDLRSAKMAPIIGAGLQDGGAVDRDSAGIAGAGGAAREAGWRIASRGSRGAQLQRSAAADAGALLRARDCWGLGITALIAGFMSGMAGNVSAFATVWTYDIYRAFIRKTRDRRALCGDGPLVHDGWRAGQHRNGIPGDAVPQHHGLRAGAVQLFHRAVVRHGDSGNAVETSDARGRVLGLAGRDGFLDRHVGLGEDAIRRRWRIIALSSHAKDMAENMYRALWSLDHLRRGHCRGQPDDQARIRAKLRGWCMAQRRFRRKAICRCISGRSSGPCIVARRLRQF